MLAHAQGSLLNAAQFARSLGVDGKTVARYLDLLVDLLLLRRLPPYHTNTRKRLVKSPKVYVRDSGLLHALLRLRSMDDALGHPVAGASRPATSCTAEIRLRRISVLSAEPKTYLQTKSEVGDTLWEQNWSGCGFVRSHIRPLPEPFHGYSEYARQSYCRVRRYGATAPLHVGNLLPA
jgi:hypothetical protein